MEPPLIFILLAVITLDLLSGFVYRVLLFKNVHQTGWFTRPINIMTVLDESVKFIGYLSWTFTVVFSVILPHPLSHYTGYDFCRVVMWLTALGQMHSFSGGFGIALLRMIFIRFPSKLKLGQNATALIISSFALAISIGFSLLIISSPRRSQDLTSTCMAESKDLRKALFEYSSDKSIIYEARIATVAVLAAMLTIVILEVLCYTSIYKYLVEHEKTMSLVLSENVVKSRIRKNVIGLAGHIVNFAVEIIWLVIWVSKVLIKKSNIGQTKLENVLVRCFIMSMDGVLSIIHVAFSTPLRSDFLFFCGNVKKFVMSLKSSEKTRNSSISSIRVAP